MPGRERLLEDRIPGPVAVREPKPRGPRPGPRAQRQRARHRDADGGGATRTLPRFDALGGDVPRIDAHAVPPFGDAQHDMAGAQALARRRGQAAREPAVALGPGQHRLALAVFRTRRLEAMAAREVMDAGPR